jgi:hypothetical protein
MPTLREAGVVLTLPEIVALYDAGDLAKLLPRRKTGCAPGVWNLGTFGIPQTNL